MTYSLNRPPDVVIIWYHGHMSAQRYEDHGAFMADHGNCQLAASATYPNEEGMAARTLECDTHNAYEIQTLGVRA